MLHNEGDFQRSSPNIGRELPFCTICKVAEWSAADTCRISQPVQCSRERVPPSQSVEISKTQRLLTPTSVLAGEGVWGETGGGPTQWGDKLWKGRWSENIEHESFNVVQSLKLEKFLCFLWCVRKKKMTSLSPFCWNKKHIWKSIKTKQSSDDTTKLFFFAKVFLLFSVLTSDVERLHVSPQTVCSQRDTWTFWQVRSFFKKKK